jgi:hypothetical protein
MRTYFQAYRNEGFAAGLKSANDIASELGVVQSFRVKHHASRTKQFDKTECEEAIFQAEEDFKVNYFLVMVDMATASLKCRFEELQSFKSIFGILISSTSLKALDGSQLKEHCTTFAKTFTRPGTSGAPDICDVELNALISKLSVMKFTLPDTLMFAMELFEFVREADCYPNISIAYRILFTMPVTVASAERSFSKLKLLKNYLRSVISQERLNGLATLCIEKKLVDEIDIDSIVTDFASRNFRRKF